MIEVFWMSKATPKRILIEQRLSRVKSRPDKILQCVLKKKIIVKTMNWKKNFVNGAKRSHNVDLVLECSLTKQSICSSKSITHIVGRTVAVVVVVYDNLYGLITQGCQYSINLGSGS